MLTGWLVEFILAKRKITKDTVGEEEFMRQRAHQANGMGGLPIIGIPDQVAKESADLSRGGLSGIGISFVNYLDALLLLR